MPRLYPPSTERDDQKLRRFMNELVHDTVRTDPDSRHFNAINPARLELSRMLSIVRKLDPRPWSADVRQTASVEPADGEGREAGLAEFLYGIPDQIELIEDKRWETGVEDFRDHQGNPTALNELTAVELDDSVLLQSGQNIYRMNGPSNVDLLEEEASGQIVSSAPDAYAKARGSYTASSEIAVQVDGLDVSFAGRGYFDFEIGFTGVASVTDGADLSTLTGYVRPRKLYDSNQEELEYTMSGDTINISESGQHTLYYEGEWNTMYEALGSSRPDELPDHELSLVPIAESLYDVPEEDRIVCTQTRSVVARLVMENYEIDVTTDGYVGTTNIDHDIHHVIGGDHHAMAVGNGELTLVEPESQQIRASYSVPDNTIGVTWSPNGLLGLVVVEGSEIVTYYVNETRNVRQGGLTPKRIAE